MKLPAAITGLALLWTPALHAQDPAAPAAEAAPGFIRMVEEEGATRLQTAVVRYERNGVQVDLIGAIHIADAAYYEQLNRRFEAYEALLYEGIGKARGAPPPAGELPGKAEPQAADPVPDKARKPSLGGLHHLYQKTSKWLNLSYQMERIDYAKPNFVHADLSLEEFRELQAERGESIVGFMMRTSLRAPEGGVKKPARRSASTGALVKSLLKGDSKELKREMVHSLHDSEDQIAGLSGENVIISDRNARCLEVLEQEIAKGRKKLGIFYGAAHYPEMEKRLLEAGWKRGEQQWLTAWDIEP